MKKITQIFFAAAVCFSGTANAQKIGDTIDIKGVNAQILTIDDYGNGIAVHRLDGVFCVSPEIISNFPANRTSDGKKNTEELLKYIADNDYGLANFPALKELKSLGDGWYLPASGELRENLIESIQVDWENEDDLDYTLTAGFITFASPLAKYNMTLASSTISEGKLLNLLYSNPTHIYLKTGTKSSCYAFHEFGSGNVVLKHIVEQPAVAETKHAVTETKPEQPVEKPQEQPVEKQQQQVQPVVNPVSNNSSTKESRDWDDDVSPLAPGFAMGLDYMHGFADGTQSDIIGMNFGANIIPGLFLGVGPQISVGGYSPFSYGAGGQANLRYTVPFWNISPYVDYRFSYSYNFEIKDGGTGNCFGVGVCFSKKYYLGMLFSTTKVEYSYTVSIPYQTKEYYTVSVPYQTTETYYQNGRRRTHTVTKYRSERRSRNVTKYRDEERTDTENVSTFLVHFGIMF